MKADKLVRKLMSLTQVMWDDIATYRVEKRIPSESEAIRRLLSEALKDAPK